MARITEKVQLPTNGKFYDITEVELQSLTINEYKIILSSSNADDKVWEMLQKAVTNGVNVEDLCLQDKLYLLVRLRALCFMETYTVPLHCPHCNHTFDYDIKLNTLKVNYLEDDFDADITLLDSKDLITLKLPSSNEEKELNTFAETKAKKFKLNINEVKFITSIMKNISLVNGNELSPDQLYTYVTNLSCRDALFLMERAAEIEPGMDMIIETECPNCNEKFKFNLPINSSFFRPSL